MRDRFWKEDMYDINEVFGSSFSLVGVVNPVLLAHALLKESCQGCLSLGRVPPL